MSEVQEKTAEEQDLADRQKLRNEIINLLNNGPLPSLYVLADIDNLLDEFLNPYDPYAADEANACPGCPECTKSVTELVAAIKQEEIDRKMLTESK